MLSIKEILAETDDIGYSDYHISGNMPVMVRFHGDLRPLNDEILSNEQVRELFHEIMTEEQFEMMKKEGEVDYAYSLDDGSRLRCNAYFERGNYAISLRKLPSHIPSVADLKTPAALVDMAYLRQGLVLVTGPTGSGKSTTLAALLNEVNENSNRHIITLEAPIEYVHQNKKSIFHQREIGVDTESFSSGLRASLRQDPDVILVGEMRDLETIGTAITAAETGHLVFGTLHTNSAADTINRIIDVFPTDQQEQIRAQLANVLECVACQALVPTLEGKRVAAFEIMTATPAIRNLIREKKTFQINTMIQSGRKHGMITRDDALFELYSKQIISAEMTVSYALDKGTIRKKLVF